ncbi:hypothetical protein ACFX2J_035129 [Malus domestica]
MWQLSSSSFQTPSAAGIIFACLICSSGGCGNFFGSTLAVEDEYSKAIPCKQSGKDSKQSVLDRKIDTKCWLIALIFLVLKVRTKTRKMTWRMHDMRYSCFLFS